MSVSSALRSIETVSQTIADFLTIPITSADIAGILNQIELIKGIVREFPIQDIRKNDIINRLNQVEIIIQTTPLNLTNALSILQLVSLKVENLPINCCC